MTTYKFEFSPDAFKLVMKGIGKLSIEEGGMLYQTMMTDAQAQDAARAKADAGNQGQAGDNIIPAKRGRPPKPPANGAAEQQPPAS